MTNSREDSAIELAKWVATDADTPNYLVKKAFDYLRNYSDTETVQAILDERIEQLNLRKGA
ncbi:MAG: hypothetical protein EBR82_66550 [Caulobacteraceae bacterium]|nr:hypothetical protein [Caulobacteraceae bacterium]